MSKIQESLLVHGTTIAFANKGVLLRGPPGSGKSSFALMLMEAAGTGLGPDLLVAALVSDDQTLLTFHKGKLQASALPALKGLLEVRGLGIMPVNAIASAKLVLVADLQSHEKIDRLPEPSDSQTQIMGVSLPRIFIDASLPNAASRLRLAFRYFA